jgi:two-component system, OmpR family, response regulator
MLVDDDPFIREVVSAALRTIHGVSAQVFAAGAEALAAARRARPDIIVLDYTLPGTDGLALARELRGILSSMPPLIFLTAREDAALIGRLHSEGAHAVIAKPFDPATIAQVILRHGGHLPVRDARLEAVAANFRASLPLTMAEIGKELDVLQQEWRRPVAESLSMRVHKLAGTAGLFKLEDFGLAARDVESAIQAQLAAELRGEAPETLKIARAIAALRTLA